MFSIQDIYELRKYDTTVMCYDFLLQVFLFFPKKKNQTTILTAAKNCFRKISQNYLNAFSDV